jgi:hypothetical protein
MHSCGKSGDDTIISFSQISQQGCCAKAVIVSTELLLPYSMSFLLHCFRLYSLGQSSSYQINKIRKPRCARVRVYTTHKPKLAQCASNYTRPQREYSLCRTRY